MRKRNSVNREQALAIMLSDQQRKLAQIQREQSVFADVEYVNDHEMPMCVVHEPRVTTREQDKRRMMTVSRECVRDLESVSVRQKGK